MEDVTNKAFFLDRKKIKRGFFFVSKDPVEAQIQSGLDPFDAAILKIKISKESYGLLVEEIASSSGKFQGIPKAKVDLVNTLYREGKIVLGRGR